MKTEEFLKRFLEKKGEIVSAPPQKNMDWDHLFKASELTNLIDFGCDFDPDGFCLKYRYATDEINTKMCCCSGCFTSVGYLLELPPDWAVLEEIASFFSSKKATAYNTHTLYEGFWREGIGCVLPRKYRSPTCLCCTCCKSSSPWEGVLFRLLRFGKEEIPLRFYPFYKTQLDIYGKKYSIRTTYKEEAMDNYLIFLERRLRKKRSRNEIFKSSTSRSRKDLEGTRTQL